MNLSHSNFSMYYKFLRNSSFHLNNGGSETSESEKNFQIYLYAFTMFLSFFANMALVIIILSTRSLRTKFNFFVVNFSLVNLLIPTFCMWLHLVYHLDKGQWRFGEFFCRINKFVQVLVVCVSNFTLTVTVLDRFLATLQSPLLKYTQGRQTVVMLIVWISGTLLSLPFILYTRFLEFDWIGGHERLCQAHFPSMEARRAYMTTLALLGYVLPMLVMFFLISVALRRPSVANDNMMREERLRCQMKRRALHYVFTVLLVFFLCWSPQQLLVLWDVFRERNRHTKLPTNIRQYSFYSYYVAYASSCVYPFLYMSYNKGFRFAVNQILGCKRQHGVTNENPTNIEMGGIDLLKQSLTRGRSASAVEQNVGHENSVFSFDTLEKEVTVPPSQSENDVPTVATVAVVHHGQELS